MIESAIALLRTLAELLGAKKIEKQNRFNNLVVPVYEGMHDAHQDYLMFLERAQV